MPTSIHSWVGDCDSFRTASLESSVQLNWRRNNSSQFEKKTIQKTKWQLTDAQINRWGVVATRCFFLLFLFYPTRFLKFKTNLPCSPSKFNFCLFVTYLLCNLVGYLNLTIKRQFESIFHSMLSAFLFPLRVKDKESIYYSSDPIWQKTRLNEDGIWRPYLFKRNHNLPPIIKIPGLTLHTYHCSSQA